jgi:hypothetical protein
VVTEVERTQDLIRSAVRAMVAVSKIEGATQQAKYTQMHERVMMKENLKNVWSSLVAERAGL